MDLGWCRIEIMGHRTHIGKLSEVDLCGIKMWRVDDLEPDGTVDGPFTTHHYAPSAMFGFTQVTAEMAVKERKSWKPPALPGYHDDVIDADYEVAAGLIDPADHDDLEEALLDRPWDGDAEE